MKPHSIRTNIRLDDLKGLHVSICTLCCNIHVFNIKKVDSDPLTVPNNLDDKTIFLCKMARSAQESRGHKFYSQKLTRAIQTETEFLSTVYFDPIPLKSYWSCPGLWIRIRIGSGFSDFVDPDPY
jgi:hypothetical protein